MSWFSKKKNSNSGDIQQSKIDSSVTNSSAKVILTKAEQGLSHTIGRLNEEKGINLGKHKARVFVVLDRSGSMYNLYRNGDVQNVLTRLLPLALKFDDNRELDVYIFNEECKSMPPMNLDNYQTYVQEMIICRGYSPNGGTNYAPVINQTIFNYDDESPYPAFGIFVTDGEPSDASAADDAIRKSSNYKIFYSLVGIGKENFRYLQKLDDLNGRSVDNTSFIKVSDFSKLSDEQLYERLLSQYPEWLKKMGIIN